MSRPTKVACNAGAIHTSHPHTTLALGSRYCDAARHSRRRYDYVIQVLSNSKSLGQMIVHVVGNPDSKRRSRQNLISLLFFSAKVEHRSQAGRSLIQKNSKHRGRGVIVDGMRSYFARRDAFLHLSDIHFRSKEVSRDDDPNGALSGDIVDDVRKMRANIGRPADAILISGDIAFAGAQDEYQFATDWLKDLLCPAAGCSMDDIFVIPGNHDVDRSKTASRMHAHARESLRRLRGDEATLVTSEWKSTS